MGRSNPNKFVPNPARFTVQWSGSEGCFFIYDKEKKERVSLDLPFRFAWVESLASITGYNEGDGFFIKANEVKSIRDQELSVYHYEVKKSKGEDKSVKVVDHEGLYADIKAAVTSKSYGGKYTTIAYGVADGDNGPIKNGDIVRIELAGSALNAWIDKGFKEYDGGVVVEEAIFIQKNKTVSYYQPVFKQEQISAELDAKAFDADKAIQAWINQSAVEEDHEDPAVAAVEEDEIPF